VDAGALSLDEIGVNGGRRALQIALKPEDLIRATSAAVLPLQA
jgi:prolyl-tRNA editing enzyme YbaK/EbsC (Cys-tRNA(Pro) deacylase)